MDNAQILTKYLRQAMRSSTEEIAEHARTHHEFTTRFARLERSVVSGESKDGLFGYVELDRTEAPYGPYVHQGTPAHTIEPRVKQALRWVDGSNFVFAKRVRHPGYKGDPFLFNALEAKTEFVQNMFSSRVEAAITEIVKGWGD